MIIAQITDTHIKGAGRKAYGRVDTVAFMEAPVAHINAMTPAVDAVIVTGDLKLEGVVGVLTRCVELGLGEEAHVHLPTAGA